MSVLIRGMEMPKSCDECPLYTCMHNHDNCPLVPVPPHGRLIDADAAIANRNKDTNWCYDLCDLPEYLSDCPTIIPTEEGE